MKKLLILFLIFIINCNQVGQTEIINEDIDNVPEIIFLCSEIQNQNEVTIEINLIVTTKNKKLFNGSIKGNGVSQDFYKKLDDLNINSTFEGKFVEKVFKNGTYSLVVFYENSDGSYIKTCEGSVSSITTTTSSTITTSTSTTSSTTTTTTKPKPKGPDVQFKTCPSEINLLVEFKFEFIVTTGDSDVIDITTVLFDESESKNYDWDPVDKGYYTTYSHTWTFTETQYYETTFITYTVVAIDKNGFEAREECLTVVTGPFVTKNETSSYDYNEELYEVFNVTDRSDGPYICEKPGKGTREDNQYGRCVLWSKWNDDRKFDKADSDWIIACYDGTYIWFWRSNNQACPND